MLGFESVHMRFPEDTNIIVGQTHFIKTTEDMYEAVVSTVPQAKSEWRSTKRPDLA